MLYYFPTSFLMDGASFKQKDFFRDTVSNLSESGLVGTDYA